MRTSPARVKVLDEEAGLSSYLARLAGELTLGQKQWLVIRMLLAPAPRLPPVDEPAPA